MPATHTPTRRRPARVTAHTYTVPVVRELPTQPSTWANDTTW
jgi:hypothetical protein